MRITKRRLIWIGIILILLFTLAPLAFASEKDSCLSIISVSLSAMGTAIALIALYIAVTLYQKFGLESRFVERQADKVLELVDILKNTYYTVESGFGTYFLRFGVEDYENLKKSSFYSHLENKIVLMQTEDYASAIKEILSIKRSYWLPTEIKRELDFLELSGFLEMEENSQAYVKLNFKSGQTSENKWMVPFNKMTFDQLFLSKNSLSEKIETWLSKHCDIQLELNLNQGNEFEKK